MAFVQSRIWREATVSICRGNESPDDLGVWRQVFRLLVRRSRFDVVVTMGSRVSLAYGVLCGLLHRPSRQIMTEVFLDMPRPAAPAWRIKTALFRWVSRRAFGILTNSRAEVVFMARRFGLPAGMLRFVPMHTTIEQPGPSVTNEGYVLSIGRTLRDTPTLLQAFRLLDARLVLVVGGQDPLPADLPRQVEVHREIPMATCHELLRRAALVVIPLLPAERSTGQVVLFEAMATGKPVVATRAPGIVDYIRDGENGLLVPPGDARALADAIDRLRKDPALAERMARAALADCRTELAPDTHARRKLDAIRELWKPSAPEGSA